MQTITNKGLLSGKSFTTSGTAATLQLVDTDVILNNNIDFLILLPKNKTEICFDKITGKNNFHIRLSSFLAKKHPIRPLSIAVFWDVSKSTASRNIQRELTFLEKYISNNDVKTVQFYLFNHHLQESLTYIRGKDDFFWVKRYLENYDYHGATQFGNINFSRPGTDLIFLFSDGINSFGKSEPARGTIPVNCVISGDRVDLPRLERMVSTSGGHIISLAANNTIQLGETPDSSENFLMRYRSIRNAVTIHEDLPLRLGNANLLSGILSKPDTLVLIYGNDKSINRVDSIYLNGAANNCDSTLTSQLSLLRNYDSIMYRNDVYHWRDKLIFGLQNKVITPHTSFLVLERIEDYIRFKIAPPKELEQQCESMNYVYKSEYKIKSLEEQDEVVELQRTVENYNSKIAWWGKNEPPIILNRPSLSIQAPAPFAENVSPVTGAGVTVFSNSPGQATAELSTVVVTGMGQTRQTKSLGYATSRIRYNELVRVAPVNLQNGLTGKVSGLMVQTANNGVFADTRITLRGIRSLTGNNQPMLVLDGVPFDLRFLNAINPNDINDVNILKSSSATAVYGAEGVNGAILVTTRKGTRSFGYSSWNKYNLSETEEVEYLIEIKKTEKYHVWEKYEELEKLFADAPGFYIDMADHFFDIGMKEKAMVVLYEAAEKLNGNAGEKKMVAYILEKWKMFAEAIAIYQEIISVNEHDLCTKRDLALAFYQKGDYQRSLDMYYSIVSNSKFSHINYDEGQSIKAKALDEMNAVIAVHKQSLNLDRVNLNLIRPLPVDLRISVEGNADVSNFRIVEPGGEVCSYKNQHTKNGGLFEIVSKTTYDHNCNQYLIKNATTGKYQIRLDVYEYRHSAAYRAPPSMMRVIVFRNFQKENQSLEITNIILDNQFGDVGIYETKW